MKIKLLSLFLFIMLLASPIRASVTFFDEEPSSEPRYGNIIDCQVSVLSTDAALDIDSIRYRISVSGSDLGSFTPWRTDALFLSSSTHEARFQVEMRDLSTDTFPIGEDNYIEWRITDNASNTYLSGPYRIRVMQNIQPEIRLVQPRGISSLTPKVEIDILDYSLAISSHSILMEIRDSSESLIHSVSGFAAALLYDNNTEQILYKVPQGVLEDGEEYTFSISLSDYGYTSSYTKSVSSTSSFTPVSGGIADIVSYPNPFDSRTENAKIRFVLREEATVTINLYNSGGRLVRRLISSEVYSDGIHEVLWDGRGLSASSVANGVYYCEIIAEASSEYRKYTVIAVNAK